MYSQTTIRIARPTDHLEEVARMYCEGLEFDLLSKFENHEGFDGKIIGHKEWPYHLEFTHHIGTVVGNAPTKDNLLVFYISDKNNWDRLCEKMEIAGWHLVKSYNPYWDRTGRTYEDIDGYRVVIQNDEWLI